MPVSRTSNAGGRNILRRHGSGGTQARKAGVNKHLDTDDGTLEEPAAALDTRDPNYVSSDDPAVVSNFE